MPERIYPAARRYADALAGLVPDAAALNAVAGALGHMAEAAVPDPAARLYWRSLSVDRSTKRDLLMRLLEQMEAPEVMRPLVEVLLANNRVADLPEIAAATDAAVAERLGRTTATVTTAREVSGEVREALRARLATMSGKDVRLEVRVDPDLVGGVRVRMENRIIDDSVAGRLAALAGRFGR